MAEKIGHGNIIAAQFINNGPELIKPLDNKNRKGA